MKGQTYLASSRPSSRPPGSGELVDVEAMSTTTLVLDVQGVEAAPERKTSDCFDQSTHENAENSEKPDAATFFYASPSKATGNVRAS
ncbi:hypothetical protein MTO96_039921 [Rhipicephalus appendiculatus]